ncbi:MAG: hypothetical protein HYY06_11440 [Deltaproteobacteria bacterium]|nr:hypothetical protein [Deltaproteobacteria bacterium]
MLLASKIARIPAGTPLPLVARLVGPQHVWKFVGTVMTEGNGPAVASPGIQVELTPDAAVCRPAWLACARQTPPAARRLGKILFGAVMPDRSIVIIARGIIDRGVVEESRSAARATVAGSAGRRPCAPIAPGIAPRPLRSSWPEPSRLAGPRSERRVSDAE